MSEIVNQSLQKIAKGTGIIVIGTIIGMLFGFVSRVIIIRYITQTEYGIFSLALVLTSIFITISTLGLQEGATRYIAYFRGKKEEGKVRGVISSSIKIALVASIIFSLILFLSSDIISTNIFHSSELSTPLKIFSATIPLTVLIGIFTSFFRGFDRVEPNVYFQNILRSFIYISFLAGAILLGLSFLGVLYAYLASLAITCIAFAIYTIKKLPLPAFSVKKGADAHAATAITPIGKELLLFSFPLLAVAMLNMIMSWTDILMLGYFKTPDVVGLYNGALPLARLIPMTLTSVGFIYVPIVSGLYSKKLIGEMGRTYQVLTKWIFSVTIPLFFILFLFPETVLNLLFGMNYIQAASALRILALGFMFHAFLGLNGLSLMVMGKTRFLMLNSLSGAISNVVLNVALIPIFGIVGAAFASFLSYSVVNILNSTKLYQFSKIHPFTRNYAKPIGISIGLLALIYVFTSYLKIDFWMLPLLLSLFLFGYGLLLLLTRSFDKEDIVMILAIEKKTGIDAEPIKRLLRRFT
jgi:O-antigen/teichoic acid export membrane protein